MYLSLGKHLVQSGECLGGSGKDDESANGTVQPMHHAEKHFAGLLVLLFDILFYNIREGTIASLVSLYNLPALFVDDDNMVVLVDDFHNS